MYKRCTTEESARRQQSLEQCLLELMSDLPYDQITVLHICQRYGISRKSFYRYFDSKDDCLFALIDHTIMEGFVFYGPDYCSGPPTLEFCIRFFQFWYRQTPLLDVLERNKLSLHMLQRTIRYLLEEESSYPLIYKIHQEYLMEHVVYTVGGIMGMVLTWHHCNYQKTPEQMGKVLYDITHHILLKEEQT